MSEDLVYLSKFWPTPTTPALVNIKLTVEPVAASGGNRWTWHSNVELPDGTSRGGGGEVEADTKQHADLKCMYKLVTLLGELLADAHRDTVRR